MSMSTPFSSDEMHDGSTSVPQRRHVRPRKNFSKEVTDVLMNWLSNNVKNPYPSDEEKRYLCMRTGLTKKQLRIWLTNSRKVSAPLTHSARDLRSCTFRNQRSHHLRLILSY